MGRRLKKAVIFISIGLTVVALDIAARVKNLYASLPLDGQATLVWDAPPSGLGVGGHYIYWNGNEGDDWIPEDIPDAPSYCNNAFCVATVKKLKPGKSYDFRVQGYKIDSLTGKIVRTLASDIYNGVASSKGTGDIAPPVVAVKLPNGDLCRGGENPDGVHSLILGGELELIVKDLGGSRARVSVNGVPAYELEGRKDTYGISIDSLGLHNGINKIDVLAADEYGNMTSMQLVVDYNSGISSSVGTVASTAFPPVTAATRPEVTGNLEQIAEQPYAPSASTSPAYVPPSIPGVEEYGAGGVHSGPSGTSIPPLEDTITIYTDGNLNGPPIVNGEIPIGLRAKSAGGTAWVYKRPVENELTISVNQDGKINSYKFQINPLKNESYIFYQFFGAAGLKEHNAL